MIRIRLPLALIAVFCCTLMATPSLAQGVSAAENRQDSKPRLAKVRKPHTGQSGIQNSPQVLCLECIDPPCDYCDPDPDPPPPVPGPPPPPVSPPTNPAVSVFYEAYIPQDHIYGPFPNSCSLTQGFLYLGDRQGDPVTLGSPYSYRVQQGIIVYPDSGVSEGASSSVGYTEQFSVGSPHNGAYITSSDYDGVANDCKLWNGAGHAQFGEGSNTSSWAAIPSSSNIVVKLIGRISNPLESSKSAIQWNVSTTINNTGGKSTATVFVSGGVTCYPSHQILVNDTNVAFFAAPQNPTLAYITGCLVLLGPATSLMGPATQAGGTSIQVY